MAHLSNCRSLLAAIIIVVISLQSGVAYGQNDYRPGDRVEIEEGRDWVPGVVTKVGPGQTITVRLDESAAEKMGIPLQDVPAAFREQVLTRMVRLSSVRAAAGNAPAQKNAADAPRRWTDATGKFSITATFLELKDGTVFLKKDDGKRVEIPIDKLSAADADYATKAAMGNRASSPFTPSEEAHSAPTTEPNWSSVKTLRPKTFSKWTFKPDPPAAVDAPPTSESITLPDIPGSDKFFEDVVSVTIAANSKSAVVVREEGIVGDARSFVDLVNLIDGSTMSPTPLPRETEFLDASAEEQLIAFKSDAWDDPEGKLLTIARVDGTQVAALKSWMPYVNEDFWQDVDQAWFLSPAHLMTINEHGKALTIWDLDTVKALLNIPVTSALNLKLSLSNDRCYLAFALQDSIAIIDLQEADHVASIPTGKEQFDSPQFSDDNQRLAASSQSGVTIWDLTTGESSGAFWHHTMGVRPEITWAGDYILHRNMYLYDVPRRVLLWEYHGLTSTHAAVQWRGGRMWAALEGNRGEPTVLSSYEIPHAAAQRVGSQLGSPEDLLLVKPGDKVAIRVDVDRQIGSNAQVGEEIAANLTAAGFTIDTNSPLVVEAVCKRMKSQTIKINKGHRTFRPRPEDILERTIVPHTSSLTMKLGNEVIWEKGHVARPGMTIWLNEGESVDQALERLTRPNLDLITKAKFSSHIARPGKASRNGAYGVSQLTARGVVDNEVDAGGAAFE